MPQSSESIGELARMYEKYALRMQFEHSLINNRLTWLLVSQGLLFAAYGSSLAGPQKTAGFQTIVANVGLAISVLAVVAIVASVIAKVYVWLDLTKGSSQYAGEPFWVRTPITWVAASAEVAVPVVFAVAWACLR